MRAGQFVKQLTGYRAFIPAPLPPDPPIHIDDEMAELLSRADRALGRLDGVTSVLPNPDLFVAMYVRHESVLSSQIEGTQSTLQDVLEFEIDGRGHNQPKDVAEVVNHVNAMNYGLARLREFPLSLPLIKELHAQLMQDVRGAEREPGEFRRSQNWIGPPGSTLANATFVPPPPHEMMTALHDFEKFLHTTQPMPVLIHCGLIHAQFETIHPFLDGNGRVGRLLIIFLLCQKEVLEQPLLYLSLYLKAHRAEYYDRLTAVRSEGNWEGWLKFFLRGVAQTSLQATATARSILELREKGREQVFQKIGHSTQDLRLFDLLFEQPLVTVRLVQQKLDCSYAKANKLVQQFATPEVGFLEEITGGQRNRLFRFEPYLKLFNMPQEDTPFDQTAASLQQTVSER